MVHHRREAMTIIERPSPNCEPRREGQPVDILLLHYTGMTGCAAALERLCDPAAKVSAHYLIDEDGTVYRLVAESARAWHAGLSAWAGDRDVNGRSIGIELVNPGHEFGYRPFPEAQMAALEGLAREILGRHPIPARRVLGHSDVAPTRKQDPGELFDWARLAGAGIGLWPERAAPTDPDPVLVRRELATFGYDVGESGSDQAAAAIVAFQRHFRPERVDGRIDPETAGRAAWLAAHAD